MLFRFTNSGLKTLEIDDNGNGLRFLTPERFSQSDAYRVVAWVRRCVDLRAGAVEAMPFADWPFPLVRREVVSTLFGLTERALCLYGSAYWLRVLNKRGGLLGLRWLAPQTIRIIADEQNGLTGFERTVSNRTTRLEVGEVIYFWEGNWRGEMGPGDPPISSALNAAWLAHVAHQYTGAFFERGGIPPLIITADVLQDERERLESWWNALKRRAGNFWRALVLSSTADLKQLNVPSGSDLALPELLEEMRRQIAVAFGIPQTLLEDAANYATAAEHRRSFYSETVIPRCQMLANALTEQLFAPLGLEFRFLPERLELFQQDEATKAQALVALVQAGIMTPNEAREQLNLPMPEQAQEQPPVPEAEPMRGLTPEALADLHRWRRKCKERNRFADFTSDHIPAQFAEAVKAVGVERGWEQAFSFFSRYSAHALKREPDREYEATLRKRILIVLAERERTLIEAIQANISPPLDYDDLSTALRAAIEPTLVDAITSDVLAQMAVVGLYADIAAVNSAALEWARRYTYELVSNLTDTTREVVRHAVESFIATPGMTVGDLRALLAPAFGEVRAEMIAITEVTRAYAQAAQIYQALLRDYGLEMTRIWRTSGDDIVCPVCAPNNDKPEWEWEHPDGPPAHPRCRCWVTLTTTRRRK